MDPRQQDNGSVLRGQQGQPVYSYQYNPQSPCNANFQNAPPTVNNYSNATQSFNANGQVNTQACSDSSQIYPQQTPPQNFRSATHESVNPQAPQQFNFFNNQISGNQGSNLTQAQLYERSRAYIPNQIETPLPTQGIFGLVSNCYARASYTGYYNQWNAYCYNNNLRNSGASFGQTHATNTPNISGTTWQPVSNQQTGAFSQGLGGYNSSQISAPSQTYVPGLAGTVDNSIRNASSAANSGCASFVQESSLRDNLPLTFKLYMEKCFKLCETDKEKEETASYFKSLMFKVLKDKSMYTINWTTQVVPEFLRNNVFKLNKKVVAKQGITSEPKANKRKLTKAKNMGSLPLNPNDKTNRQNKFKMKVDNNAPPKIEKPFKDVPASSEHVVGTSNALEKQYLRLTSAPDPSSIRPLSILQLSFKHVVDKWRTDRSYYFICEQLKSIRQDITIQGIKNEFVVKVYEKHAKLALSCNDIHEFNQCQNCLKTLYKEGFKGNEVEFIGYRLLYYMYTEETIDVMNLLKDILNQFNQDKVLSSIKKLYKAWVTKNYPIFFSLYKQLKLKKYSRLIDYFIERERLRSLSLLLKSFYPVINIAQLIDYTGFSTVEDVINWLEQKGIKIEQDQQVLSCKYVTGVLENNQSS